MVATPDIVVSYSIKALRDRAGLSMREMAEIMGLKSASSYQNYENPDKFKKHFIPPDKIELLVKGLVGKGDPPITESDVRLLGYLTLIEAKTVQDQNQLARETVDDLLSIKGLGRKIAEPTHNLIGQQLQSIQAELQQLKFAADLDRRNAGSQYDNLVAAIGIKINSLEATVERRLETLRAEVMDRFDRIEGLLTGLHPPK